MRKQSFVESWLQEPQFKGWLAKRTDNSYKAKCVCCKKELVASKSELQKHSSMLSHIRNTLQLINVPKITSVFTRKLSDDIVKVAELKMVFDVIEHDRSFNSMSHIVELQQSALPDSTIVQGLKLKRTKIVSRNQCIFFVYLMF